MDNKIHKKGPITTDNLQKMIAKFEEISSFDVRRSRGRKPVSTVEDAVKDVTIELQE